MIGIFSKSTKKSGALGCRVNTYSDPTTLCSILHSPSPQVNEYPELSTFGVGTTPEIPFSAPNNPELKVTIISVAWHDSAVHESFKLHLNLVSSYSQHSFDGHGHSGDGHVISAKRNKLKW